MSVEQGNTVHFHYYIINEDSAKPMIEFPQNTFNKPNLFEFFPLLSFDGFHELCLVILKHLILRQYYKMFQRH